MGRIFARSDLCSPAHARILTTPRCLFSGRPRACCSVRGRLPPAADMDARADSAPQAGRVQGHRHPRVRYGMGGGLFGDKSERRFVTSAHYSFQPPTELRTDGGPGAAATH